MRLNTKAQPGTLAYDKAWHEAMLSNVPGPWRGGVLKQFHLKKSVSEFVGNTWLRETSEKLEALSLPASATDADLQEAAQDAANRAWMLAKVYKDRRMLLDALVRQCQQIEVEPPTDWGKDKWEVAKVLFPSDGVMTLSRWNCDKGRIARMLDPQWWLRRIREGHGQAVEMLAIQAGMVHKRGQIYLSDLSFEKWKGQQQRNAEMLERTYVENENGERFSLAELAGGTTSNKAIRRGELMVRIKGFEAIARDCCHAGEFVTLTCPSKFHAVLSDTCKPNPKYQDFTPKQAQEHLCKVWQKARSALHRRGIAQYGFRIAEPHHDECPHWHLLLFIKPEHKREFRKVLRRYALQVDGGEKGAWRRRITFKSIDWSKGSAAGYIAKYISKNIDGYGIETDLYGEPALVASQRVCAWASTWGIRQFQQIGGAPVSVWRELRRVKAEQIAGAPERLKEAWDAVQKIGDRQADWKRYTEQQGGVFCGRGYRIRVATEKRDELGKYGDEMPPQPVGVYSAFDPEQVYQSERHTWVYAGMVKRRGFEGETAEPFSPRTRVNNCTQPGNRAGGFNEYNEPGTDRKSSFRGQSIVGISTGTRQISRRPIHGRGVEGAGTYQY